MKCATGASASVHHAIACLGAPTHHCSAQARNRGRVIREHNGNCPRLCRPNQFQRNAAGESMKMNDIWLFFFENLVELGRRKFIAFAIKLAQVVHLLLNAKAADRNEIMMIIPCSFSRCRNEHFNASVKKFVCQSRDINLCSTHRIRIKAEWNLENFHLDSRIDLKRR